MRETAAVKRETGFCWRGTLPTCNFTPLPMGQKEFIVCGISSRSIRHCLYNVVCEATDTRDASLCATLTYLPGCSDCYVFDARVKDFLGGQQPVPSICFS